MKRTQARLLAMTAALLIIAMATAGVGYGLWSKVLTINGTVNTGTLDAVFTSVLCTDTIGTLDLTPRLILVSSAHTGANGSAGLVDTIAPPIGGFLAAGVGVGDTVNNLTDGSSGIITARTFSTVTAALAGGTENDWDTGDLYEIRDTTHPHFALDFLDKDVSSTTAVIAPPPASDPEFMNITVVNAYPSNANDCQVEWTNVGSIPVKVESITINGIPVTPGSNDVELELDGDPGDGPELWIQWIDGLCEQVDPGIALASSLKWHTEQGATEDETYTWQMLITLNQWNESACP